MSQEPELLEDIEAHLMEEARQDGPSPAETALAIKPQQGLTDNLSEQVSCSVSRRTFNVQWLTLLYTRVQNTANV